MSIPPHDDDRFAEELDRFHSALRGAPDPDAQPQDADSFDDGPTQQRVIRSKPVLELLNEFLDRPDLLSSSSGRVRAAQGAEIANDAETGDRRFDRTGLAEPRRIIPQLERLGRFEIVRELGRGGNGIVVLANDLELKRRVAIKIPRVETALSAEAKIRFTREAKAAAALSHPGIVAIHEVGHEQGIDFIVNQFVDGINLAEWSDNKQVSPEMSAEIVAELADAIQHAHQRGVLHRDLKPSNVIVENSDSNGDVSVAGHCRIADFGLAAIRLDNETPEDWTQTGSLVGTPAYMAPEQASSRRDAIGPPTDVYGLGVILYQLLTGHPPFVGDDLLAVIAKVKNVDPVAPIRVNRQIPRDVDAITMKCLEKQPSRRYQSAADLRADLTRFLNREPVLARPSTSLSRTVKWIQRNTLATGLLLALLLAVVGTSIGLIQAKQAQTAARKSEAEAKIESATAQEVSRFLEDMFEIPDLVGRHPGEPGDRKMTAEDILMHGAEKIRSELDDQPIVKARLMTKIGAVLGNLDLFDQAEELLNVGLELRQRHLPANHADIADSHRQLGRVLRKLERTEEAESHLRQAIDIYELNPGEYFKPLAGAFNELGILLRPDDPVAAREAYCRARDLNEQYQPDFEMNWAINANIAVQDYMAGRYELALETFLRAIELAEKTCGADDVRVATLKGSLSRVYLRLGDYWQAKALRLSDIEITEKALGVDDTRVGIGLIGLAEINQRLGLLSDALENGNRALTILRARLPADHSHVRGALNTNAVTLMRLRNYSDALAAMEEIDLSFFHPETKSTNLDYLRHQILRTQIERQAGQHETALDRINLVLANPRIDENRSTGMAARFCLAFILAEARDSDADNALVSALDFAKTVPSLAVEERFYLEAVYNALRGYTERATADLNKAIESGFKDARLLSDPDLASIHDTLAYRNAVTTIQQP